MGPTFRHLFSRGEGGRLPLFVFLIAALVATVTLVEVHRSHGDVHADRKVTVGLRRVTRQVDLAGAMNSALATSTALEQSASQHQQHHVSTSSSTTSNLEHQQHSTASTAKRRKPRLSASKLNTINLLADQSETLDPVCHVEEHADYMGETVLKWGHLHLQDTAGDCCSACMVDPTCNVWVYCGQTGGCGMGRAYKECWLKHASNKALRESIGTARPENLWTSGTVVDPADIKLSSDKEADRLKALKEDKNVPLMYMDVNIKGKPVGRIVIALFYKQSPLAAENFRQLCTGEKGTVPSGHTGAGGQYSFKGSSFYRIVDRFIDQSGANTDSVYGGMFKDDPGGLKLKHDRPGLLSMANTGPDTNTAHFSILLAPAPHLDGLYVVFGEVVEGMGVARTVNQLGRGKKDNTAGPEEQAIIMDCGQLRAPRSVPLTMNTAGKAKDFSVT